MAFSVYNATVHPDDWLSTIQTQCIINNIKNEKEILRLCKLNIDKAIVIPEVNSTTELVGALKNHPSFNIFKNDCKAKIDAMKFEGGDTAQFLADIRNLINNAEIDNPDDVRRRLLNTYSSNDFFRNEFSKRVTRATLIDDMFKIYSDVVSDGSKIIKYVVEDRVTKGTLKEPKFGPDNLVTIKHVPSGRYLTSIDVNYQTGSQRQAVSIF